MKKLLRELFDVKNLEIGALLFFGALIIYLGVTLAQMYPAS